MPLSVAVFVVLGWWPLGRGAGGESLNFWTAWVLVFSARPPGGIAGEFVLALLIVGVQFYFIAIVVGGVLDLFALGARWWVREARAEWRCEFARRGKSPADFPTLPKFPG